MELFVVPPVGTWIEILIKPFLIIQSVVVPPVGTWIEMCRIKRSRIVSRRAPRGHVD